MKTTANLWTCVLVFDLESRDSMSMRSGEATLCKDAYPEPSPASLHVNMVPHPSLTSKREAQHMMLLKQCQAIWQAADSLSQADTASSASRRGSPLLMPSQPPKGKDLIPTLNGFFFHRHPPCLQSARKNS